MFFKLVRKGLMQETVWAEDMADLLKWMEKRSIKSDKIITLQRRF